MNNKKKVLILTYYWPPAGGPGVQRFLKFCKYFNDFSWQPVIISPKNGSYPYLDESLEKEIPDYIEVVRTKTFEPFALYNRLRGKKGKEVSVAMTGFKNSRSPIQKLAKYIRGNYFIPDARKGWVPYAVKAAGNIIKHNQIDAIITTGPPQSTHLAGLRLKEKFDLPWIADFRDPWTSVYYNRFFPRTEKTKRKDKKLEDKVLYSADAISVISPGLKEEFINRAKRLEIIYNGYDEQDFKNVKAAIHKKFILAYVGNLKPNQNVKTLWNVLAAMKKNIPDFARKFSLQITGLADTEIKKDMKQAGISDLVQFLPFVQHKEAIQRMTSANMLLFIIPESKGNRLILTGKIFEYLACKKPMLSIGPCDGDAAAILQSCGRKPMIDYKDSKQMQHTIRDAYKQSKSSTRMPLKLINNVHEQYSRKGMTGKLAELLNDITQ